MTKTVPPTRELAGLVSRALKVHPREKNRRAFIITYQGVTFTLSKKWKNITIDLEATESIRAADALASIMNAVTRIARQKAVGVRLMGITEAEAIYFEARDFECINHGEYWQVD